MARPSVDLRSDTITRPTAAMREAMAAAEVGDDVYGEDPTVNRLQELAAAKVGMEAALFVPSGTMGNTCALMAHTHPGDEVVLEAHAHMRLWEGGNYASLAGLSLRTVDSAYGIITPDAVAALLRAPDVHYPPTRLVCLENTHNSHSASAWLPAEVEALARFVRGHDVRLHMDGARLFNAAVAVGADPVEYTRHVDSVMFCVSKGLSAPIGSLLCGSRDFVTRAARMRKRLGGGMRQAGVIAAAGIVALECMVDRLAEDHAHAARLAAGLGTIDGFRVRMPPVATNMVHVDVAGRDWSGQDLIDRWAPLGILCNARPPSSVRLVTHRHIRTEDVVYVIEATRRMVDAA